MHDFGMTDQTPLRVKRVLKDGTVVYDLGAAGLYVGGMFGRTRRRGARDERS